MAQTDLNPQVILGIDPGYDRLGWAIAVPNQGSWHKVELGCIETNRDQSLAKRYQQLEQNLQKVIDQHQPTQAAVETLFFAQNTTTALKVAEVRGIILAILIRNQLKIEQYNPMKIKQTVTGNGKADKKAVEKMIRLEFKLNQDQILDDAIDALAVAFTHHILAKNMKYYA